MSPPAAALTPVEKALQHRSFLLPNLFLISQNLRFSLQTSLFAANLGGDWLDIHCLASQAALFCKNFLLLLRRPRQNAGCSSKDWSHCFAITR